jgi:phage/plasmid-associated DNA primase
MNTPSTDIDFLKFLATLAPEGETVLFGKAVQLEDGSLGYVPTDTLPPNAATYINTGSFIKARAKDGKLRAKLENMEHTCFLMCDDIGTKSKTPPLEPTWKIETSPGNFQWGYAFSDRPTKDEQAAAVKAIGAAGFSDPGASGAARWCRIPGSLNIRKQFVAKLTEFHPERRFTLAGILEALGVTIDAEEVKRARVKTERAFTQIEDDGGDDVLAWLAERGDVLAERPTADGCWHVRCPAAHEHSDGNERAGYWPATRGFKCLHSHGDDWKSNDFLQWVADQGGPEHTYGARPELLFKKLDPVTEPIVGPVTEPPVVEPPPEMTASTVWLRHAFAAHGLTPEQFGDAVRPLADTVPSFAIRYAENHLRIHRADGTTATSGASAPAFLGDFTGAKTIFASDSWINGAALHIATGFPVIIVENWSFGEIMTEDGESVRALHTGILDHLHGVKKCIVVTTASVPDDDDGRRRLSTFRVLLIDEGLKVQAWKTPPIAGPNVVHGVGQCLLHRYGAQWPAAEDAFGVLFAGKTPMLARVDDDDLADAALTYTLSDDEMFGSHHLDLTDRGAGSYLLSKRGWGSFYWLKDKRTWVRWDKGRWHDIGTSPLFMVDAVALGYTRRARALNIKAEAMLEEANRLTRAAHVMPAGQAKTDALTAADSAEVAAQHKKGEAEEYAKRAKVLGSTNGRQKVLADLQGRTKVGISSTAFDKDPYLLGVANGVVDLKTGLLREMVQEDMMLRRCPTPYLPGVRHAKMEKLLVEVTASGWSVVPTWIGDGFLLAPQRLRWFKRRLGAALMGYNVLTSFEILHGVGSNGKTVIGHAIESALGKNANGGYFSSIKASIIMTSSVEVAAEAPTPMLAGIMGSRIVFASEAKDTDHLNAQLIKVITGGDDVLARGLYKDATDGGQRPTYTLFLLTNPLPNIPNGDPATWDRVAPFHFKCRWLRSGNTNPDEQHLPKEDRWYADAAKNDKDVAAFMLSWMVEGCVEYHREGLGDIPEDVLADVQGYKEDTDQMSNWVRERGLAIAPGKSSEIGVLYDDFARWCFGEGHKAGSKKTFAKRLLTRYPSVERDTRHGSTYRLLGIGWADGKASSPSSIASLF